jgi:2-polyprenyl-3-methyl-5-hydroxy-6-metoxy-1,4-benzoquinol methylase
MTASSGPEAPTAAVPIPLCDEPWPEADLETVDCCPVCHTRKRSVLFTGLCDTTHFVAPGHWTMWRCEGCGSGYLDPRPTSQSIGRAYGRYHTHREPGTPGLPANGFEKLRVALANGYRNRRYGTRYSPAHRIGYAIGRVIRPLARPSDRKFRFLDRRNFDGPPAKLLDVGCGDGAFLAAASEAGWDAFGIDFDPTAVEGACARGLNAVVGGLDTIEDQCESYEAVTLSHVIEHLYDPGGAILSAYRLLKPGGRLYIDTPNIDAIGCRIYGRHWRGLEPPRHLVIFNRMGLASLLNRCGFENIQFRRELSALRGLGMQSARIAMRLDPNLPASEVKGPGIIQQLHSSLSRNHTEFVTFTCEKPRR